MKSKDQQLLEEAYNKVIANIMAGANNPGWTPEQAFTSGRAFEPKGVSPRKKETASKRQASAPKKQQQPAYEDEEFDVEEDPVGSYRSIASPPPEEDHTASMMYVSKADIEKVFHDDPRENSLYEILFKAAEAAVEQDDGGIVFRYVNPEFRRLMQQKIDAVVHK